jgi:hypothetical protein
MNGDSTRDIQGEAPVDGEIFTERGLPTGQIVNLYWLVISTPLNNMKVSWDDYSQHMEIHTSHVPNHQRV